MRFGISITNWFRPRVGQSNRMPVLVAAFGVFMVVQANVYRNPLIDNYQEIVVTYHTERTATVHALMYRADSILRSEVDREFVLQPGESETLSVNIGVNPVAWSNGFARFQVTGPSTTLDGYCQPYNFLDFATNRWQVPIYGSCEPPYHGYFWPW